MAIIKYLFIAFIFLSTSLSMAHTVYDPSDIPLLDNRFRIDPEIDEITFILHHSKGYQRVVLVKPDGSKMYKKRHPDNVAWVRGKTQDIVTIKNPTPGPWQAVATLDGDNRIKLLSKVQLKVSRLPLKLYANEYITTHASLYYDGKIMDNRAYLDDAKLSISMLGDASKKLALYLDDGKQYDELPFDGKLTARILINIQPGRYLFNIHTKNDIFTRNVNKDAVVFLPPITYKVKKMKKGSDKAIAAFSVDINEIKPDSVTIDGAFIDISNKLIKQVQLHSLDNISDEGEFKATYELPFNTYTFSGKAYATTLDGREIELQLPDRQFELLPVFKAPEEQSEAVMTEEVATPMVDEDLSPSIFKNIWVIIAVVIVLLLLIVGIVIFVLKRKKEKNKGDDEISNKLSLDELQPMSIDIKDVK